MPDTKPPTITLPAYDLITSIAAVWPVRSRNLEVPQICRILFETNGVNDLWTTATDGRMLAQYHWWRGDPKRTLILHPTVGAALDYEHVALVKAFSKHQASHCKKQPDSILYDVKLTFLSDEFVLDAAGQRLSLSLDDLKFPPYKKLIGAAATFPERPLSSRIYLSPALLDSVCACFKALRAGALKFELADMLERTKWSATGRLKGQCWDFQLLLMPMKVE